jgi:hypothetical protein
MVLADGAVQDDEFLFSAAFFFSFNLPKVLFPKTPKKWQASP